jgi:hypothetical protein
MAHAVVRHDDYQAMGITTLHQSLYASMQDILHLGGFLSSPAWYQNY